jgi:DNA-directed RNA polymerase subunit omega
MGQVSLEDFVSTVSNRFDLVLAAAFRARQPSGGAEPAVERNRKRMQ